tara:strand:- start:143 stop:367 length:225 start_codon:yes stop_codon:yes gene_type:complete
MFNKNFRKLPNKSGNLVNFLSEEWEDKGFWISKGDAQNRRAGGWTLHHKRNLLIWRSHLKGISYELDKIRMGDK